MPITLGTVANKPLFWNRTDCFNQMATAAPGTLARKLWDDQIQPQVDDTNVAHPSVYGELGCGALIQWERTGDTKFATLVHDILLASETDGINDRNWERGYSIQAALTTYLIWPALSAEQQQPLYDMLQRLVNIFMGVGTPDYAGGFRVSDTDQTTGQFWGLMIAKQLFPDITFPDTTGGGGNFKYVLGGLDSTGSDQASVRNSIRQMVDMAVGGEWLVSSGYNVSDDTFLLKLAWLAMLDITGVDHMPEVAAWIKKNALVLIHDITPDFADSAKWGDTQAPDLGIWDVIVELCITQICLARLGETKLASWIQFLVLELFAKYGDVYPYRWNPQVVLWLDPFAPAADYRQGIPRTVDCSQGIGQVTRHDGFDANGTFLHVMSPNSTVQVDHECFYLLSPQIYSGGRWVARNPVGYGPTEYADILTSSMAGGWSVMERFGFEWVQDGEKFLACGASSSGKPGVTGQYLQPDRFVNEWLSIFVHLPELQAYVKVERMDFDDPRLWTDKQKSDYPIVQQKIAGHSLKEVMWCAPNPDAVVSPTGATWMLPDGSPIRLDIFSTGGALTVMKDDITKVPGVDPGNLNALTKGFTRVRFGSDRAGFEAICSVYQYGATQVVPVPSFPGGAIDPRVFGFHVGDVEVLFTKDGSMPTVPPLAGETVYSVGTDATGKWGVTVQAPVPVVKPPDPPQPDPAPSPAPITASPLLPGPVKVTIGNLTFPALIEQA
jgi:hypothetical protein